MRTVIKILILLTLFAALFACKKEIDTVTPKVTLTAEIRLKPTLPTIYYDLFVSNDKIVWVWFKRVPKQELISYPLVTKFIAPKFCLETIAINKPLYGASRETLSDNSRKELDTTTTKITY